ncbi:MAG: NUDIX domain-containing protein [Gemmataceae bacterium]|nr:NUDIX domain-containing protein [Gemmataceae bacterium]
MLGTLLAMISRIARVTAGLVHRLLLVVWRHLPLGPRRLAIRILYPQFPIGAVAIVQDAQGRILLVRQTYHREGIRWGAPGGWLSGHEHPREAAAREAFEETGLRVRVGRVLDIDSGPYGEVSLAFECEIVGDSGFRPSEETDEIGWFAPDALPPMTVDTRRLLERSLRAQAAWQPAIESPPAAVPEPRR